MWNSFSQNNILIGPDDQVRLSDVGMSPIHDNEIERPKDLRHYAQLYDQFAAPELPRDYPEVEYFDVKPSADIFSMAMLFLFLLLPITPSAEPSSDFCRHSESLRNGDAPNALPANFPIRRPLAVFQQLWDLIRVMTGPSEQRPSSAEVLRSLDSLRRYVEVLDGVEPMNRRVDYGLVVLVPYELTTEAE